MIPKKYYPTIIIFIVLLIIGFFVFGEALIFLFPECDYSQGGWAVSPDAIHIHKTCECKGIKLILDDRPIDGDYYSSCLGFVTSRECVGAYPNGTQVLCL